jgi:vancomycin resistance protein YoaR
LGGYETINEAKAEKIFSWLVLFAMYHKNEKLFKNPNVAHALCKFHDKVSTKTKDFKAALNTMEKNPNIDVKNAKFTMEGLGIAKEQNEESVAEMAVVTAVAAE